jgi:hypothetical protein
MSKGKVWDGTYQDIHDGSVPRYVLTVSVLDIAKKQVCAVNGTVFSYAGSTPMSDFQDIKKTLRNFGWKVLDDVGKHWEGMG